MHIVMQEAWALIGSFLSATRVPERWFPGRFDFLLNSHNLMHILVVFGAVHMHAAASADLLWLAKVDNVNAANNVTDVDITLSNDSLASVASKTTDQILSFLYSTSHQDL